MGTLHTRAQASAGRSGARRLLAGTMALLLLVSSSCSDGPVAPPELSAPTAEAFQLYRLTINPRSASGSVGDTVRFTATVKDWLGRTHVTSGFGWYSSNTAVAQVLGNGAFAARQAGPAKVYATYSGRVDSASVTVTGVVAPVQVSTASVPGGTVGITYAQTLAASGGNGSYSWALAAGALPAGLALNSATGAIGGTPTAGGVSSFTVRVTSGGSTATKALSITVAYGAVNVTTTSLPGATVGTSYGTSLSATGGNGSYSWSLSAGALPSGLSLNATSGAIAGTPTTSGTWSFTVRATSSGATDTQALSLAVAAAPPPSNGEPVFNATTGAMVFLDNMERYTDVVAMGAGPQGSTPRISPVPAPVTTSQPVNTSTHQLIAGRNGGKALRMVYSGAYQSGTDFITLNAPTTSNSATHHFTYWARITYPGGPAALSSPDRTIAIKWFMAWHRVRPATRIQWQTHDGWPCNAGPNGSDPLPYPTYWGVFDQAETGCQGYQPVGPWFHEVADAQWHRFTYQFRPHSAAGARDGFARMWIDGTKVIDVSKATCGVTPPGGQKPWCALDDLDALSVNDGVVFVRWGGPHTDDPVSSWTYDVDDFSWWVTP